MKFYMSVLVFTAIMLTSCVNSSKQTGHFDPAEKFNRSMYHFNHHILDFYLIRPVAIIWRDFVPELTRNELRNFTSNLEEPAAMINCLLQGDPYRGMVHFTRFFLNTLLGMGGIIDVAGLSTQKLQYEQIRRFGSTLGYYGIGYGPYMYLPFYGSFTLRDNGGDMIDTLYPVLSWLTLPLSIGKWVIEGIETRAKLLDSDSLLHQSYDPYIMIREIYFQNHDFIVNGGQTNRENNANSKVIENILSEIDMK